LKVARLVTATDGADIGFDDPGMALINRAE
jgi:hypothetical protein